MNNNLSVFFTMAILVGYLSGNVIGRNYCIDFDGSEVEQGRLFTKGVNPCFTCICGPNGKELDCEPMRCNVPYIAGCIKVIRGRLCCEFVCVDSKEHKYNHIERNSLEQEHLRY